MKNKHDMYIVYEHSYKKRGRKNKIRKIAFILLLVAGLGSVAYFVITSQTKQNNIDMVSNDPQTQPTVLPTLIPTPLQLPTPILTPEPALLPVIGAVPTLMLEDLPIENDTRVKVKGIYVTSNTSGTDAMQKLIELVETTEINTMVIDVKDDHGKISYDMDHDVAEEIGAITNTISDMEDLIAKLKEKDIYLIARIVAFKDPYLAEKRQDLAIKNSDGTLYRDNNGEGWVNPYNHEVWDYLVDVAKQAALIGFDEVQFDYIRFSTGAGIAKADFGDMAKEKSKEEIITEFTKYAYENIKPLGVFVSADVFGTIINSSIDASLIGQNYIDMAKYLDYICPMIYPSHFGEGNYGIDYPDLEPYNIVRKVLKASADKLNQIPENEHRAIVRPWLQDFSATWIEPHMKYGAEELRAQIKGVYDSGYEEWLLWNSSCHYSMDGLDSDE